MIASPKLKPISIQHQPSTKTAAAKLSNRARTISTPSLIRLLEKTNPCWLCGGFESIIVPANDDQSSRLRFALTFQASVRCINCNCFLGVAGGRND